MVEDSVEWLQQLEAFIDRSIRKGEKMHSVI
jgi:hypothetical protein